MNMIHWLQSFFGLNSKTEILWKKVLKHFGDMERNFVNADPVVGGKQACEIRRTAKFMLNQETFEKNFQRKKTFKTRESQNFIDMEMANYVDKFVSNITNIM